MNRNEEIIQINGPAGVIEVLVENPGAPRGIALVCHPHPLFGGTNTNKVTHALARAPLPASDTWHCAQISVVSVIVPVKPR